MSSKRKKRLYVLLSIIPRHPQKKTATQLLKLMQSSGFKISLRTMQRDLKHLEAQSDGVTSDQRELLFGWYRK